MPRLIYKDNLIEMCNAFADSSRFFWKAVWKEFAKTVEEIAEVDAEPVKHGYWGASYIKAFNSSDDISHLHMYCSSCGYHLDLKDTKEDAYRQFKYCPNCGAKMNETAEQR